MTPEQIALLETAFEAAKKAGKIVATIPGLIPFLKSLVKSHSKVKTGAFCDCSIKLFGDKACIMVDKDRGEVIMLTSDTIQSCRYVESKKKVKPNGVHTYFYYDITFKDGRESYVRMNRKKRDAMMAHM